MKNLQPCWPNIKPWLSNTLVKAHVKLVMDGSGLEITTWKQILENMFYYISNNKQMILLGETEERELTVVELRHLGQWFSEMWSPDQQHQHHLETY